MISKINMVRVKGLEPPRLAAPEPKCGESAELSGTWAFPSAGHTANKAGKCQARLFAHPAALTTKGGA